MVIRLRKMGYYKITLSLLIISNICFYTMDTLLLYIVISAFAMGLSMLALIIDGSFIRLKIDKCIGWLITIYGIFTINGLLRLRSGDYNWDMMLYTCLQSFFIYESFKKILRDKNCINDLGNVITVSTIVSIIVLLSKELGNFGVSGFRIGDSLSGNVNVAGANFGILSVFISFLCSNQKKKMNWIIFGIIAVIMLFTGSKMTIIILAIDLLFFLSNAKKKQNAIVLTVFAGLIFLILIFSVPALYEVIGVRIEDMLFQLFHIGPGKSSHSTGVRLTMIKEGFDFWMEHPLFGGGEKYFGTRTSTIYGYSHCNYTELLCNAGILGFGMYYFPIFSNLINTIKKANRRKTFAKLVVVFLVMRLILDWMQVTYSEPCVGYIPMVFSFAYLQVLSEKKYDNL